MNLSQLLVNIIDTDISVDINHLCLNANQIQPGDVFIALQGTTTHGANFINQAIENGCSAILVDSMDLNCNAPWVRIDNLSQHLEALNKTRYPNATTVEVIGVTGTNGKTSVAHFIAQLFENLSINIGLIGTLGISNTQIQSEHTTPDICTLYRALEHYHNHGTNLAVLEISSHALEQNRVAGINLVQAIFTNLTQDHLDYHKDLESYKNAKLNLFKFKHLKSAIVNGDDPNHLDFLKPAKAATQAIYHLSDFSKITSTQQGFICQLDNFVFEIGLLGEFNLSNLLAAINSVEQFGFEREQIIPLLPNITAPPGRMQQINNTCVWIDYAHTPDAIKHSINTLKQHYPDYQIRIVFGCGGDRDHDKRAKMGKIASMLADGVVLTNDNPRSEDPQTIIDDILSDATDLEKVNVTLDRQLAIENAIATLKDNECLLIAGKGHERTQVFDQQTITLSDIEIAKNAIN